MINNKNVIGNVSVEVKATLSVDEQTFRTCLNLITIHAKQEGIKGIILVFPEDDHEDCVGPFPIFTKDGLDNAFKGLESSEDELKARSL